MQDVFFSFSPQACPGGFSSYAIPITHDAIRECHPERSAIIPSCHPERSSSGVEGLVFEYNSRWVAVQWVHKNQQNRQNFWENLVQ